MTPAEAIASLDSQLAAHGQTVIIRKTNAAAPAVTVKAFVRGLQASDIAGTTLTQSDKKVTVSPSGLGDFVIPSTGGFVVIDTQPKSIVGAPEILKLNDVVVRINMLVKG
jgi:hypothetical protein